jgi:hypothetical protein
MGTWTKTFFMIFIEVRSKRCQRRAVPQVGLFLRTKNEGRTPVSRDNKGRLTLISRAETGVWPSFFSENGWTQHEEIAMRTPLLIVTVTAALGVAGFSSRAEAGDPVAGAILGGVIGAAAGGPPGAVAGAIIGSAIAAPCCYYDYPRHYGRHDYGDRRYYAPPPVAYYGPPRVAYYAPPPVAYYEPAPVYYAPTVVYRSRPAHVYGAKYAHRHDERRDPREERHYRRGER